MYDFYTIERLASWVRSAVDAIDRIIDEGHRWPWNHIVHVDARGLYAIIIDKDKMEPRDDEIDASAGLDGHRLRRHVVTGRKRGTAEESVKWRVCIPLAKADRSIGERLVTGWGLRLSWDGSKHTADTGKFQSVPPTGIHHRNPLRIVRVFPLITRTNAGGLWPSLKIKTSPWMPTALI